MGTMGIEEWVKTYEKKCWHGVIWVVSENLTLAVRAVEATSCLVCTQQAPKRSVAFKHYFYFSPASIKPNHSLPIFPQATFLISNSFYFMFQKIQIPHQVLKLDRGLTQKTLITLRERPRSVNLDLNAKGIEAWGKGLGVGTQRRSATRGRRHVSG